MGQLTTQSTNSRKLREDTERIWMNGFVIFTLRYSKTLIAQMKPVIHPVLRPLNIRVELKEQYLKMKNKKAEIKQEEYESDSSTEVNL